MAQAVLPAVLGGVASTVVGSMLGGGNKSQGSGYNGGMQMAGNYPVGYNPAGTSNFQYGQQGYTGYNPYEMPSYEMPAQPTEYIYPEGRMYLSGNKWIYEDNPDIAAEKKSRTDMINKLYAEMKTTNPERAAQIEEYGKNYEAELLKTTQPLTEQALIGRGLGGSTIYKDAITDLITKAGKEGITARESLKTSDENSLLNMIASLQSGVNADVAAGQRTAGLAQNQSSLDQQLASRQAALAAQAQQLAASNYWNQQNLGYNYWNANNAIDSQNSANTWSGVNALSSFLPYMFGGNNNNNNTVYKAQSPIDLYKNTWGTNWGGWS